MLRLYKQSLTKLAGKRSYNSQANSVLSRTTCLKTNFLNRDLSGPFKDRQQGLENKTVREHEERIIRELREELKKREENLKKAKEEEEKAKAKDKPMTTEEQLELLKKQLEEANKKIEKLTKKK